MAINKKLIHFKSKENFEREVANNNILNTSICFIQDSKEISTHGTVYSTVNWSILSDYEYVDLGLPSGTPWATCNIGANAPEEYGDYFAWGEIFPKSNYGDSNSVTYGLSYSELKSRGIIGSDGNLTAEYDAAHVKWGGNWRMPTKDEQYELCKECTWERTAQNGVNGYRVTGPNGNSIFLPAAGCRYGTSLDVGGGSYGYYWSSTPSESSSNFAQYLYFDKNICCPDISFRYYGLNVRPVYKVYKTNTASVEDETLNISNASYSNNVLEIQGAKVEDETLIL